MSEDRLSQLRKGYEEEDYLALEPPDLEPIRVLAETAEFERCRPGDPDLHRGRRPGRSADQDAAEQSLVNGDDTVGDDSEMDVNAAAVAAYRPSLDTGAPLSERKLAAMFGKTSRRWARNRIAEAAEGVAPATATP